MAEERVREALSRLVSEGNGFVDLVVYVKPEQRETKLVLEGGELVFYTEEPPLEGRANADLIRFLARALGVPTSRVEIVYGVRDRTKRVRIYEVTGEEVVEALSRVVQVAE